MSGAVRFGLFADPHCAEMVYADRYCEESVGKLEACIDVFERSELDFVVCMGDMIDAHEDPEVELGYLVQMREVFERFGGGERHWVIGNHDVVGLAKEEFLANSGSRGPYYSFDVGDFHFVTLDGNCHEDGSDFSRGNFEWDEAWVSAKQLEWLAEDLVASDRQSIVFCHENVDWRLYDGERDPHVLCNARQIGAVLKQAGSVRAVFQAHYHPGIRTTVEGIDCVGLRAMVVGSGMENTAFAIVTADPGGTIAVEGFGQQPSYKLQRPDGRS